VDPCKGSQDILFGGQFDLVFLETDLLIQGFQDGPEAGRILRMPETGEVLETIGMGIEGWKQHGPSITDLLSRENRVGAACYSSFDRADSLKGPKLGGTATYADKKKPGPKPGFG